MELNDNSFKNKSSSIDTNNLLREQRKITYPIINNNINNNNSNNTSLVHKAAYVTIGTVTLVTLGSLFWLFLCIKMMDDCIQLVTPTRLIKYTKNQIDWTSMVALLSHQLTNFAEWEKSKRSWYGDQYPIDHEDKFQDLIITVTTYMNNYVNQRKQQQKNFT